MFRAYDSERDRLVAVKRFTLDLTPERVRALVSEFERLIGAGLEHPAIAAPLATGVIGASAYLAQEYVSAESLDLAVREYGPAPPGDGLRVAAQLAGALDFASAANVHHGALHPRDVLLSPDDTWLTGLGVTRALEQVGVTAPVRRPYTAPERNAGTAWDRRADIFSLAAIVHELLWGRRITGTGAEAAASLTDIADGDLAALRSVFARALAEDPADRFATALEFAEALALAFPNVVVVAPPPPMRPAARASRKEDEMEPRLPLGDPEINDSVGADLAAPTHIEPDLDLRPAEDVRYADVEIAPAIVTNSLSTTEDAEDTPVVERIPNAVPAGLLTAPDAEPPRSHSGPLIVMLIFGATAGLAGGYLAWSRPDPVAPPQVLVTEVETKPVTPPAREFTESTVPEASKRRVREPGTQEPRTQEPEPRTPNPEPRTQTGSGRLLVRSTPAGATVFVDGREHGRTPVAVRDLARGAHRVRLVRDGYASVEQRVVITRSRPAQSIVVSLAAPGTPGRDAGDLVVESKPAGAKVYVDNKLSGTTPLSLPQVPAGNHVVRLERDGYRRWASSVRVVAAERNRVTASLER